MSKTLTKDEVNQKKFRRINDKSLRQLLIHRFTNAYGYDKGQVTAQAIVDDILKTIEHYFVVAKPLEQMAARNATCAMANWSGWLFQWMSFLQGESPLSKLA